MSDFRALSGGVYVSPQIAVADLAEASRAGRAAGDQQSPGRRDRTTRRPALRSKRPHAAGWITARFRWTMQSLSREAMLPRWREALGEAPGPVLRLLPQRNPFDPAVVARPGDARGRSRATGATAAAQRLRRFPGSRRDGRSCRPAGR